MARTPSPLIVRTAASASSCCVTSSPPCQRSSRSTSSNHLDGQALDAVEEVGAQPRRRRGELDAVQVRDHLLEPDLDLQLREMGAEAEVGPAEAEREMAIRLPADVEPV